MSVIVKGMNMPSKCQYCGLLRYYPENGNVWCNASNKLMMERAWFEKIDIERPMWCPLIALPEKHGRLIDADAFSHFITDTIKRQEYENLKIDGLLTVADVLEAVISDLKGTGLDGFDNAPTIIEAEGGTT